MTRPLDREEYQRSIEWIRRRRGLADVFGAFELFAATIEDAWEKLDGERRKNIINEGLLTNAIEDLRDKMVNSEFFGAGPDDPYGQGYVAACDAVLGWIAEHDWDNPRPKNEEYDV